MTSGTAEDRVEEKGVVGPGIIKKPTEEITGVAERTATRARISEGREKVGN